MKERGKQSEPIPVFESLIRRGFVENILSTARSNLLRDGHLSTMLFLHLAHGERFFTPVTMPHIPEEKQAFFTFLGRAIQHADHRVGEAVLLAESWIVMADENQTSLSGFPSQHPNRKEAITVAGRDARNTNFVFAIQPFGRDQLNQPVFETAVLEQFYEQPDAQYYSTGLLDYLFY
jgi:hypothetical protein